MPIGYHSRDLKATFKIKRTLVVHIIDSILAKCSNKK